MFNLFCICNKISKIDSVRKGGILDRPGIFYNKLVGNAGLQITGSIVVTLINFLSLPYIVSRLGESAFGVYAYTAIIHGYLAFLDLGISTAMIKYVAESHARGERERTSLLINTAMWSNLAMGLAGGVLLFAASRWIASVALHVPDDLLPAAITVFRIAAVSFLLNMATGIFSSLPAALQKFGLVNLLKIIFGVLNVAIMIGVLYAGCDVVAMMAACTALILIMVIVYAWLCMRLVEGYRPRAEFDSAEFRDMFRFGVFTLANRLNTLLLTQMDRFLIGLFLPIEMLTFFIIPATFAGYILKVPLIVLQVLFPLVSEIQSIHENPREALRAIQLRGSKYFTLYVLPLCILTATYSRAILTLWVGPEIAAQSSRILQLLAIAYFISSTHYVPSTILNGIGKPQINAYILPVAGVLNLALCLLLIPRYGINGAGYSLLISMSAVIPAFVVWTQARFIGVKLTEYAWQVIIRPLGVGLVTAACFFRFAPRVPSLAGLLLNCAVYTAIFYTTCIATGAIDREDRARITGFIKQNVAKLLP